MHRKPERRWCGIPRLPRTRCFLLFNTIAATLLVILLFRSSYLAIVLSSVRNSNKGNVLSNKYSEHLLQQEAISPSKIHVFNTAATTPKDATGPKIAIITFTTKETSYTHLSLKNKHMYATRNGYDLIIDWDAPDDANGNVMWHKFTMIERTVKSGQYDWIWWIDFDTLMTNMGLKIEDVIHDALYNQTQFTKTGIPHDDPSETASTSTEIDSVDPEEIDFLFTGDCFPLNAGSMIVRGRVPASSTRKSRLTSYDFLQRVRKYHLDTSTSKHRLSEQDCIRDLLFPYQEFHSDFPSTRSAAIKAADEQYATQHTRIIPQWHINSFPVEIKCYNADRRSWREGDLLIHFAGAWAHLTMEDPTGHLMRKYASHVITTGEAATE